MSCTKLFYALEIGLSIKNYVYISIVHANFDAPSWNIAIGSFRGNDPILCHPTPCKFN